MTDHSDLVSSDSCLFRLPLTTTHFFSPLPRQRIVNPLEVFRGVILDDDLPPDVIPLEAHARPERPLQDLDRGPHVRVFKSLLLDFLQSDYVAWLLGSPFDDLLHLTDGKSLRHDPRYHVKLRRLRRQLENRTRVPRREVAGFNLLLDFLRLS